jgi:hypothetical protein
MRAVAMKKTMNRICYFFLILTTFTIGLGIIAKESKPTVALTAPYIKSDSEQPSAVQLPDEDSTFLNSIVSALGGFSGGGLLLIFLIRRLVNSYDDNFSKMETRLSSQTKQQDDKNDKIINMIEDVHGITQELKMEVIKLQVSTVDKDSVMEAITKVAMLETDVNQVRGEVKSIMTHLLNKPRMSGGLIK